LKRRFFVNKNRVQNQSGVKFIVAIFLCVLIIPLLFANIKALQAFLSSFKELKNVEANLQSMEERKGRLERESGFFDSNFGVEKEIREKFPVAKEGEEVIIFTEMDDIDHTNSNGNVDEEQDFWFKIKSRLGF
jgi:hypothetical protein